MVALRRYLGMSLCILLLISCATEAPDITLGTSETGADVKRGERIIAVIKGGSVAQSRVSLAGIALPVEIMSSNSISFVIPNESPSGVQMLRIKAGSVMAQFSLTIIDDASVNTKMLIIVKPDVRQEALVSALAKLGFSLEGELNALGAQSGPCRGMLAVVDVGERNVQDAEIDLEALGEAFLLEPWGRAEDVSPLIDPRSDYGVDSSDYSDAIGVSTAHKRGYGGKGITIAILDTGVNEHTDLSGRVLDGRSFVGVADQGKSDSHTKGGHGTPIALLAAGTTLGVAPQADILPVRVCDADGHCPAPAVIQGLCYVLARGAESDRLDRMVLNLSWGNSEPSSIVKNILGYASSQGVLTATSAGNDYKTNKNAINYPAHHPIDGLLAVAALENVEDKWLPTEYSNRGHHIDISAPGEKLSLPTGTYSGTSFATALVSGALALYLESFTYKRVVVHEAEGAVKTDATKLPEARPEAVGQGVVNLRNLLDNRNVLVSIADRDNIHYDYLPEYVEEWPEVSEALLQGSYRWFHISSTSQGFLKFDLSNVDKPIKSARLLVYRVDSVDDDCTMKFYQVLDDSWQEGDIASLPTVDTTKEIGTVESSRYAYVEIDISSYAQSQQLDGKLSVAFDCDHRNWVIIGAREWHEKPKLILNFDE